MKQATKIEQKNNLVILPLRQKLLANLRSLPSMMIPNRTQRRLQNSASKCRHMSIGNSQPRIDWFAFHRQNSKDALVHASKRFPSGEALESFDAERELR